MCLSPEVDVVAGIGITVIAIDALRHVRNGRTLPFALLPAIFAFHTFVSAFVWWGAQGSVSQTVGDIAATVFMFIAFVLFPIWTPISILILEKPGWRRDALLVLAAMGIFSGINYLTQMFEGNSTYVACDWAINYSVDGVTPVTGGLYLLATIGAMLLSGYRTIFIWGIVNAVGVAFLLWANSKGLPSVWCLWAAVTSWFVAWWLRKLDRRHKAGERWPWLPTQEDLQRGGREEFHWPGQANKKL